MQPNLGTALFTNAILTVTFSVVFKHNSEHVLALAMKMPFFLLKISIDITINFPSLLFHVCFFQDITCIIMLDSITALPPQLKSTNN